MHIFIHYIYIYIPSRNPTKMTKFNCIKEKVRNIVNKAYSINNKFYVYKERKPICLYAYSFVKNQYPKINLLKNNVNKKVENYNYNIFLAFSLLLIPSFLNKKNWNNMSNKNISNCSSLEKVFLLKTNELKNGEMKEIKIHNGQDSVLLVNVNDEYFCVGPKCPHYSAPLQNGLLTKSYVTCPWHDAKFDLKSGECINGPSFSDIPTYKILIDGDNIFAYVPTEIENYKEKKVCSCTDSCEKKTILIVGGGAATIGAIETFLKLGYSGKLIICSKDSFKPYDKPLISKNISNYNSDEEYFNEIKLKEDEYYNKTNIQYMHNIEVEKVDTVKKKAYLNNGEVVIYDQLLIASGVSPTKLMLEKDNEQNGKNIGKNGKNIEKNGKNIEKNGKKTYNTVCNLFNLNCLDDNCKISEYAKEGTRCVIIGSSFIACELASALKKKNVNVTLVSKDSVPHFRAFGNKLGNVILNILKDNKINFYPETYPIEYIYDNSKYNFLKNTNKKKIHGVKLENGEVLKCDFVIEAVGCHPNSDFLDKKFKDDKNYIPVDEYFKLKNSNDIYAAGDVCIFPYFMTGNV
uniref:Rieske domain-containing protein n=1 Tax=Piliocolobus tephrosceles TaxID=591936 RepID=A0A8C9GEH2_9PRIM